MKKALLLIALLSMLMAPISALAAGGATTAPTDLNSQEFQFDLSAVTHPGIDNRNWVQKGVDYFFERAVGIILGTAGTFAMFMITVGGFKMLISAGSDEGYESGKNNVVRGVVGLAIVLGAYILVSAVQLLATSIFQ